MKIKPPDGKVRTTLPFGTTRDDIAAYMKEYRAKYPVLVVKDIKTTETKYGVELEITFRVKGEPNNG